MPWYDNFAYLNGAIKGGYVGSVPAYRPPTFHTSRSSTYDPWASGNAGATLWGQLSSGTLPTPTPKYKPPTMPERIDLGVPASTTLPPAKPPEAPKSTQGDFFGSIGAAIGDTASHLNLGNVIPWFMERVNVASGELANAHIPVLSTTAEATHAATGAFLGAIQKASDVMAPVMDAFPNWYRDTQLADRAKLYKGVVTGTEPDFGIFGPSGNIIPFSSPGVREQLFQYRLYRDILAHSLSGSDEHRKAEVSLRILRDSIDLPESVKAAIEADPNGDASAYLDHAPEGRQFSYQPGLTGIISNAGYPLMFYLAEAKLGYGAARAAAGAVAATSPFAATAVGAAARATTIAAKLQLAMTAAGVGYQAVSTVFDGVARYQGDQAAIDWFDKVNRTTTFSDDPRVQLVTSFSVNPFAAVGLAKKGIVRLASGTGDVTIGRLLGARFTRYYTHTTLLVDQIKRMYRLGSTAEAEQFLTSHYASKGQAFDEVVGVALDHVLNTLPGDERIQFVAAHPDPVERTAAALRQYGSQTMDALTNHPDEVAKRWNQHSWEYHQYPGNFNAEVAFLNARDMQATMEKSFAARGRLDAVVGYTEFVPPRGQALAADWLDRVTQDGKVKVEGVNGVQDLIRQLPAMRKYWQGLIPAGATSIPRLSVEEMLNRAGADYARAARQNPLRVATGADPILRPDSPTLQRDYADALGTNVDTVRAVNEFKPAKPDATSVELMRTFLADKLSMEAGQAAALTPQQVFEQASKYIADTTDPWLEMGSRVVSAEKRLAGVRAELVRLASLAPRNRTAAHADTTVRLEKEMADITQLIRTASDPLTPFSEAIRFRGAMERRIARVKGMNPEKLSPDDVKYLRGFLTNDLNVSTRGLAGAALHERAMELIPTTTVGKVATVRDAHLAEMATRKVDAIAVLDSLDAIDGQAESMIRAMSDRPWSELLRRTPEGDWGWSGGTMPVSAAMRTRMADFLRTQGGRPRAIAADALAMGDAQVWDTLRQYPGAMERMTVAQRRYITAAQAVNPTKYGMDEYANAWMKANEKSSGDWFDALTQLRDAREELLAGRLEHNLRRTADMNVPPIFLAEARGSSTSGESVYYDAEFDAVIHPQNLARVRDILAQPTELYVALREVVNGDPLLRSQVDGVAAETGIPATELLRDPVYADKLRGLVASDFQPPVPGMVQEVTPADFTIRSGDAPAVARLADQTSEARNAPAPPLSMVPEREAQRVSAGATKEGQPLRPSTRYQSEIIGAGGDLSAATDEAIMADPANALGMDVLSYLNHGILGTKVATTRGALALLREIENGGATRAGLGPGLQAEGQRVALDLIRAARNAARREGIPVGVYSKGLDPAMMAEEDLQLARTLEDTIDPRTGRPKKGGVPAVSYDPSDPLGTLQYGLKKRPKDAVVAEWAQVPGLSEEFLAGHFEPWQERIWTAEARHAFNWVFGRHPNAAISAAVRQRFVERAGRKGVDPASAGAVWDHWRQLSVNSRDSVLRKIGGQRRYVLGDRPQYATVANIPTTELDAVVHGRIGEPGVLDALLQSGEIDAAQHALLQTVDYGALFREASSFTRRHLEDLPGQTLGHALASAYGIAAHNKAVTTMYYWFRFGADIRFHAMNYLESQILYLGRAGLRKGEIDQGMFGQSSEHPRNLEADPMNNTGYAEGRGRARMAERTFLKEQPDAMRKGLLDMQAEDPATMEQALREIATQDGELSQHIALNGDNVDSWLAKMNAWHGRMLRTVDEASANATIDEAVMAEAAATPAMAEVYGRIAQVNKDLWANVRSTFYGNAERSRAERFLNSYLLFWPLSYQIKASKWMIRVLFDRAGGLQTNAGGAYVLDHLLATHNQLLATDPAYRDWYEKHKTLTFVAQMLMPITWDSMGVSLSPALRDLFFARTKSVFDVGPIYTLTNLVPALGKELYADVYPTVKDLPFFNEAYRGLTGRNPPKAPVDRFAGG